MNLPRILVAGLCGGGGKTLVTLGLIAAWRKAGRRIAAFKKGPDYIDAAWLSVAAQRPCRNLDLFMMSQDAIRRSFDDACADADLAVIEGNRGLFDGVDAAGTCSSAELAKLLEIPVLLVVDATKSTRTAAAIVLGCQHLDPQLRLDGVILNRTAGARHVSVLRQAIEEICHVPVLGAIPKIREEIFPERHLGLVPPEEHSAVAQAVRRTGELAEKYLDLDGIWKLAQQSPTMKSPGLFSRSACSVLSASKGGARPEPCVTPSQSGAARNTALPRRAARFEQPEAPANPLRIGVFRDAAFAFYYPENLEALQRQGAELVEISPLRETELPKVSALYIGGGFPEMLASPLSANTLFMNSLRRAATAGLPVYAECGGAIYLGQKLLMDGQQYPMAGVLPVIFGFGAKPQGHGYTILEAVHDNPFFSLGQIVRGHEFHYSFVQSYTAEDLTFAFRVHKGYGFDAAQDGLCCQNVMACYTHLHALGVESWAPALVRAAARFEAQAAQNLSPIPASA